VRRRISRRQWAFGCGWLRGVWQACGSAEGGRWVAARAVYTKPLIVSRDSWHIKDRTIPNPNQKQYNNPWHIKDRTIPKVVKVP
jgi:hypothetical protein